MLLNLDLKEWVVIAYLYIEKLYVCVLGILMMCCLIPHLIVYISG